MHLSGKAELPPKQADPRLNWGTLLEPTILRVAAQELNMKWVEHNTKVQNSGEYMSCTIDGRAESIDSNLEGPGILECKNHDLYQWLSDYQEKPSIYEELQLQWQMMVTGFKWGYLCVLVGGNDLQLFPREPRPAVVKLLEDARDVMIAQIKADEPPDPTGAPSEQPQLNLLYPDTPVERTDLGVDDRAAQTFHDYAFATEQKSFWGKAQAGDKVNVLALTKDARETFVQSSEGRRFRAKVSKTSGTRITMKELPSVEPVTAEPSEELMI
tara:strand:- start:42 stop:851 length:810 start_codon:yes stop_codon:yes gene_type:complete